MEHDARLGLRVPAEAPLGDDVEEVVRRQAAVRRRVEVVGRRIADRAVSRPVLARQRLVRAVRQRRGRRADGSSRRSGD